MCPFCKCFWYCLVVVGLAPRYPPPHPIGDRMASSLPAASSAKAVQRHGLGDAAVWSAGEAGLEKVALNPQRCAGLAGRFFHPCGSAWCALFGGYGSRLDSAWCGDGDCRAPHPGVSTEGGVRRAGRHGPAAGTPVLVRVYCRVNQLPAWACIGGVLP